MTQAIIQTNLDELLADCGTIDAVSWQAPEGMTYEKWMEIGRAFGRIGAIPRARNIKPAPVDGEYALGFILNTDNLAAKPCVYIVKESSRILYVGSSAYGPKHRLKQHVSAKTPLGQYIKSSRPFSDAWKVEIHFYKNRRDALANELKYIDNLGPEINER